MGMFYGNATLRGKTSAEVAAAIQSADGDAWIREDGGAVTAFAAVHEDQDLEQAAEFAESLSRDLEANVLSAMNHDDDLLVLLLHDRGELVFHYVSSPGYFEGEDEPPDGGDVSDLCAAFGASAKEDEVRSVLGLGAYPAEPESALDRHRAVARLLGLPESSVGVGYAYIGEDNLPPGVDRAVFTRV